MSCVDLKIVNAAECEIVRLITSSQILLSCICVSKADVGLDCVIRNNIASSEWSVSKRLCRELRLCLVSEISDDQLAREVRVAPPLW